MLAEVGDQVGQGVHQAPCMNCGASWHRDGLPRGTAGGGHGKEGEPPQLRQSKKERGPFTRARQRHVLVLPCYVYAVIKFPL